MPELMQAGTQRDAVLSEAKARSRPICSGGDPTIDNEHRWEIDRRRERDRE
jgi:hypothetical protein